VDEILFDDFADCVAGEDVHLLDASGGGRRDHEAVVGLAQQRAAVAAGETDYQAARPRLDALDDVGGRAAGRQPDRDVVRGARRPRSGARNPVVTLSFGVLVRTEVSRR
jgi:hypothetical protein